MTITGVGYKILPTFSPILTRYVPCGAEVDYENLKVTATVAGEISTPPVTGLGLRSGESGLTLVEDSNHFLIPIKEAMDEDPPH